MLHLHRVVLSFQLLIVRRRAQEAWYAQEEGSGVRVHNAMVLLMELGSGQALVTYHQPAMLFLHAYTIVVAAALFIKCEKERVSVGIY
jgi:hypothetical protein